MSQSVAISPTDVDDVTRITYRKAALLILAASIEQDLPSPNGIIQNGIDSSLLLVNIDGHARARQWFEFFGYAGEPHVWSADGNLHMALNVFGWNGWAIYLRSDEPLVDETPDADELAAVALAAGVTA